MSSSDIPRVVTFIEQLEVLTSELKHMMSETKPVTVTPDGSANTDRTRDQLSDATPATPPRFNALPAVCGFDPHPEAF